VPEATHSRGHTQACQTNGSLMNSFARYHSLFASIKRLDGLMSTYILNTKDLLSVVGFEPSVAGSVAEVNNCSDCIYAVVGNIRASLYRQGLFTYRNIHTPKLSMPIVIRYTGWYFCIGKQTNSATRAVSCGSMKHLHKSAARCYCYS
jgi:hypothetical protein